MTSLRLSDDGVETLIGDVRHHGARGVETGAMLLTAAGDPTVTTIALVGISGVIRERGLFVLTMPVIDALFSYAEQHDLQVRAQLHSHEHDAFLSPTDRAGGIRMRGFVAAVVPTFRAPPRDPGQWGWWSFASGDWATCAAGEIASAGPTSVVTVDADGVR